MIYLQMVLHKLDINREKYYIEIIKENKRKMILRQRIAKDMEHKILCGKWSLHSAIPAESQLCNEYHVSKTTIRSALQDLESKGFIKIAQGKRAVVVSRNGTSLALIPPQTVYSKEYILSALESRMIFERGIAGLAAERITDEEITELQACYEEMLSSTNNIPHHAETDFKFHMLLGRFSKNPLILIQQNAMEDYMRPLMKSIVSILGAALGIKHHKILLETMQAHNRTEAEKAMETHLLSTIENISAFFNEHPDITINIEAP